MQDDLDLHCPHIAYLSVRIRVNSSNYRYADGSEETLSSHHIMIVYACDDPCVFVACTSQVIMTFNDSCVTYAKLGLRTYADSLILARPANLRSLI